MNTQHNKIFTEYRSKESNYWEQPNNVEMLRYVLDCDEVIINEGITESDFHLGCDAVAKKMYRHKNMLHPISHSVSLRTRYNSNYLDINFRNNIKNPLSEIRKILSYFDVNSTYAKYFVQCFDVSNNKAKFCVKWQTSDIAKYVYSVIEHLPNYYKESTKRYDIPVSEAVSFNAVIYDLSGDKPLEVNYDYIVDNYRSK